MSLLGLLTEAMTYVGLVGALVAWWLVRGTVPALTGLLGMCVVMFTGYLVVEWLYALGMLSLPWYSLGRKVPGRIVPAVALWWFVARTLWHVRQKALR